MPTLLRHTPPADGGRRVFLAVPSYGPVSGVTAFCLFRAHSALQGAGFTVELGLLLGDCHVDDARNRLVRDFLASGCDDLVFIDADIGWQDADLVRILGFERDIVGATYPLKQGEEDFPCRHIGGEIWSDSDGLIEVDGLPTGFLRIRRHVLKHLARGATTYRIHGADGGASPAPLIFERAIVNGGRVSGDYHFCAKARAAGFRIWCDPNCYLEHVGEKTWSGTYGAHLRRKNGLGLIRGIARIADGTEDAASLMQLSQEWGNEPYSASVELLKMAVHVARQVRGPILETGSGLTSLAMAASNPLIEVHCLEHSAMWGAKTVEAAKRLGLVNIHVHTAPLVDTPAGRWYDPPRGLPWESFDLVLCDGPPRLEGNRRILFGVMATHDCRPRCILVDDADTEGDSIPEPYRTEIKGEIRKFAVGVK